MAIGKNKKTGKTGKKGSKKRVVDPFTRKEWYKVRAPNVFEKPICGLTCVNKTQGTKIASESLKGRIMEVCLADLQGEEELAYRKIKLRIDDVRGNECLTNFHSMDLTTDKHKSLIRKWHTLVEAGIDVKTIDGYFLRVFAIALTARRKNQLSKACYAQSSQVRALRRKMRSCIKSHVKKCTLQRLVSKFILESISKAMKTACATIFPLQNVFVRKVKMLKMPKFDPINLEKIHAPKAKKEDVGQPVATAGAEVMAQQPPGVAKPKEKAEPLVGEAPKPKEKKAEKPKAAKAPKAEKPKAEAKPKVEQAPLVGETPAKTEKPKKAEPKPKAEPKAKTEKPKAAGKS